MVEPEELVGSRDGVQVGLAPVHEDGVRVPDPLQHLDVERHVADLLHGAVEGQARVRPHLPEVAVDPSGRSVKNSSAAEIGSRRKEEQLPKNIPEDRYQFIV